MTFTCIFVMVRGGRGGGNQDPSHLPIGSSVFAGLFDRVKVPTGKSYVTFIFGSFLAVSTFIAVVSEAVTNPLLVTSKHTSTNGGVCGVCYNILLYIIIYDVCNCSEAMTNPLLVTSKHTVPLLMVVYVVYDNILLYITIYDVCNCSEAMTNPLPVNSKHISILMVVYVVYVIYYYILFII